MCAGEYSGGVPTTHLDFLQCHWSVVCGARRFEHYTEVPAPYPLLYLEVCHTTTACAGLGSKVAADYATVRMTEKPTSCCVCSK